MMRATVEKDKSDNTVTHSSDVVRAGHWEGRVTSLPLYSGSHGHMWALLWQEQYETHSWRELSCSTRQAGGRASPPEIPPQLPGLSLNAGRKPKGAEELQPNSSWTL